MRDDRSLTISIQHFGLGWENVHCMQHLIHTSHWSWSSYLYLNTDNVLVSTTKSSDDHPVLIETCATSQSCDDGEFQTGDEAKLANHIQNQATVLTTHKNSVFKMKLNLIPLFVFYGISPVMGRIGLTTTSLQNGGGAHKMRPSSDMSLKVVSDQLHTCASDTEVADNPKRWAPLEPDSHLMPSFDHYFSLASSLLSGRQR